MPHKRRKVDEACKDLGLPSATVLMYVEKAWVTPEVADEVDDEDLARLRLIRELQEEFGVNDDAVPLILHLIDQLNALRTRIKKTA